MEFTGGAGEETGPEGARAEDGGGSLCGHGGHCDGGGRRRWLVMMKMWFVSVGGFGFVFPLKSLLVVVAC